MANLDTAQSHDEAGSPRLLHETRDANIRGVFAFGVGLVVTGVVVSVVVWLLFRYLAAGENRASEPPYPTATASSRAAPAGLQAPLPPEPRLQVHPREDLIDLRRHEDEVLGAYGWVDKNAGLVRIPIEEAMRIAVERGLPARSRADSPPVGAEVTR
ncbi:MAG TPA: hypothetical protein VNZ26_09195 [Vicinamibacterales bacterium]|nr:hypothetical protein [Vicinamibacterales bacterium]